MLKRRLGLLGVVAVASTAAACGGSGGGGENVSRTEEIPVKLTIKLRGDLDATVEDQVATSRFVLMKRAKSAEKDLNILGVEPLAPIKTGNVALIGGVALHPFQGDGTYTIPTGSAQEAPSEEEKAKGISRSRSSVRVEWWPDGDVTGQNTEEYLRRAKECTAKVEEDGTKGRVFCPSITGVNRQFSFEMTWDVV